MIITFEDKKYKRKFEAEAEDIEDIHNVIESGMLAMGYAKETAKQLKTELKEEQYSCNISYANKQRKMNYEEIIQYIECSNDEECLDLFDCLLGRMKKLNKER